MNISIVGGKVLKNNYLMSTSPTGVITKLETEFQNDVNFHKTNNHEIVPINQNSCRSENSNYYHNKILKSSSNNLYKNKEASNNQSNEIKRNIDDNFKNETTRKLNEKFEVTSNGMIRLKRKIRHDEDAYLRLRAKEPKNSIVNLSKGHSSSVGSLPQINKHINILNQDNVADSDSTQYINTKREIIDTIPMSLFAENNRNPTIYNQNSKYRNSELIFESSNRGDSNLKINNDVKASPNYFDMKRTACKEKDLKSNKITLRGRLMGSSTVKEKLKPLYINKEEIQPINSQIHSSAHKTPTSPLSSQKKKIVKPKEPVTVNVAISSMQKGVLVFDQERGSTPALHNPSLSKRDNLISPRMTRTKSKKDKFDKRIDDILENKDLIYLENDNSLNVVSSFSKTSRDKVKSRNVQRKRLKEFNEVVRQRSLSRGSRIEGKLNEDEMLPVAQELSEEELSKYQKL